MACRKNFLVIVFFSFFTSMHVEASGHELNGYSCDDFIEVVDWPPFYVDGDCVCIYQSKACVG